MSVRYKCRVAEITNHRDGSIDIQFGLAVGPSTVPPGETYNFLSTDGDLSWSAKDANGRVIFSVQGINLTARCYPDSTWTPPAGSYAPSPSASARPSNAPKPTRTAKPTRTTKPTKPAGQDSRGGLAKTGA